MQQNILQSSREKNTNNIYNFITIHNSMQTLTYTITIQAPVSKVRDTMLNHPTYEQRTEVFAA